MSIVKSLSVGNGDMFYIKHGTSNFSIIDCCMNDDVEEDIVAEIKREKAGKSVTRFISTHPDDDHIRGLEYLDNEIDILNFYCVENETTKEDETDDFKHYCELRDSSKAFHIYRGCRRKWMNETDDDEHGSSGIHILWPYTEHDAYKEELSRAKEGGDPNNISPIVQYSLSGGVTMVWMGDLGEDFMNSIIDEVEFSKTSVLFAPHHGRKSGTVPDKWLEVMDPDIIVIGEADSQHLNYYDGRQTITQNSAGNIIFDCSAGKIHIHVSSSTYTVLYLENEDIDDYDDDHYYIGTLNLPG
ncbi:MAG: MBL fold metallo-hydrolase [Chloracidobacterium sp.]|nr:MBL fold metallo-hydrolase [Chloracidobacterium sp.]